MVQRNTNDKTVVITPITCYNIPNNNLLKGYVIMDGSGFVGTQIGNYRITAEINSGAFGSVYKAEHMHLKARIVAIKLLHAYMGSSNEREQFLLEAQFLAMLEHPHILPLIDFGFSEGRPYLIAKYAVGGSLRDLLRPEVPLPVEYTIAILKQIGQALYYAHERNIIHRDLKPENILFNEQGEALLADFGIATMLATASVKHLTTIGGTPPYMAPEQFQGIISKEGDQYALGCIAYELMTGRLPFTAPDFLSMGFKHLTESPTAPSQFNSQLPTAVEAVILKAMAKQRVERHTDIPAFLVALQTSFVQPVLLSSPLISSTLASERALVEEICHLKKELEQAQVDLEKAEREYNLELQARLRYGTIPKLEERISEMESKLTSIKGVCMLKKEQWLSIGKEHYEAGRRTEALAAYEQAIRFDPNDVSVHHMKLLVLDNYDEALSTCEQIIRLNPKDAFAYNIKGLTLVEVQRYDEAIRAFDNVIRLNTGDVITASAYNDKGSSLIKLQHYEGAIRAFDQAIYLNPNNAKVYSNKGLALMVLQRYNEALSSYEQAIHLDPHDPTAYFYQAMILVGGQRYGEAINILDQAIHFNPLDSAVYCNKGLILGMLKRHEEVIRTIEQAIRLDPNSARPYALKGFALYELQRYNEALGTLEQAIRLDPQNANTHYSKGLALYELQIYNEAISAFNLAIFLDPHDARAYQDKGLALIALQRYDEAISAFDQAIRLDSRDVISYLNKGNTLNVLQRHDEAITDLGRGK